MTTVMKPQAQTVTLRGLKERLGREVQHQPTAVHTAACTLMQALTPPPSPQQQQEELVVQPRIMTMLLFGPSGCGKTQLALATQALLRERGVPCLRFDASTCKDETSVTRFTGAGAGYEGCQDQTTLPDMLADLLVHPEKRRIERMNKSTREFREAADRYNAQLPVPAPRLLYIFVDEIDKAHNNLIVVLNGLLDSGQMTSARGRHFQPPPETTLLFVFTANYADAAVCRMTERHTESAQQLAREAMVARGLQHCTIERFGQLVPFYPLETEQLRDVLHCKLERHLARTHHLNERYGAIGYTTEVKECLVNRVVSRVDVEGGLRRAMRELFHDLDMLYVQALDVLSTGEYRGVEEDGPLSVFVHTLVLDRLATLQDCPLGRQIAQLLCDEMNTEQLTVYQRRRQNVAPALGMRSDRHVHVYRVLSLACTQTVLTTVATASDEINHLRRENRLLKRLLVSACESPREQKKVKHCAPPPLLSTTKTPSKTLLKIRLLNATV